MLWYARWSAARASGSAPRALIRDHDPRCDGPGTARRHGLRSRSCRRIRSPIPPAGPSVTVDGRRVRGVAIFDRPTTVRSPHELSWFGSMVCELRTSPDEKVNPMGSLMLRRFAESDSRFGITIAIPPRASSGGFQRSISSVLNQLARLGLWSTKAISMSPRWEHCGQHASNIRALENANSEGKSVVVATACHLSRGGPGIRVVTVGRRVGRPPGTETRTGSRPVAIAA